MLFKVKSPPSRVRAGDPPRSSPFSIVSERPGGTFSLVSVAKKWPPRSMWMLTIGPDRVPRPLIASTTHSTCWARRLEHDLRDAGVSWGKLDCVDNGLELVQR